MTNGDGPSLSSRAVMVTVALAACVLPAHRATTIDPLAGLRQE